MRIKRTGIIEIDKAIGGALRNMSLSKSRNSEREKKNHPDGVHPAKVKGKKQKVKATVFCRRGRLQT
jgi:hypothetical protein